MQATDTADCLLAARVCGGHRQLISKYVLLFPALDVASAFPLNAITLVRQAGRQPLHLSLVLDLPSDLDGSACCPPSGQQHHGHVLRGRGRQPARLQGSVSQSVGQPASQPGNPATARCPAGAQPPTLSACACLSPVCVLAGKTVGFRLLAAVPPVLGALVTRNLSTITDWSGTAVSQ